MSKITKQFTKFIYPFQYDNVALTVNRHKIASSKGKEMLVWEQISVESNELREGLSDMLNKDGSSAKIADCYRFNNNCRHLIGLSKNVNTKIEFISRANGGDSSYQIAISDIRLYLFESFVGMIEIEVEYDSSSIQDYIDCNYFISESKSQNNQFVIANKIWDATNNVATTTVSEFSLQQLMTDIFSYIGESDDFDSNNARCLVYHKPIIYSYVLLDSKPDKIEELLFNIRKNYKSSYKTPTEEYDISKNTCISHPFDNSYWATSLNGVVNLSYLTDDEITNSFFTTAFPPKMRATYYYLFLNVLHQKYAMRHLTAKMGKLDKIVNKYEVMKQQLNKGLAYQAESASLKFRAFFKLPSNIEHINKYYDLLHSTFAIDTMYANFVDDLGSLVSICDCYVKRINERNGKIDKLKKAKIEIFVSVFGTLVGIMTLLNSSWSLIEKISGGTVDFSSPQILAVTGAMLLPIITIIFNVKSKLVEIKSLKKDLKNDTDKDPIGE